MPEKKDGFVGRLVQQQARRHVVKQTEEQLQQLNVSLYTFKEDVERLEKTSKRAAEKLVKQAQALGWVDNELKWIRETYKQDTQAVRVADQKIQKWGKRFGWLKQVIQHHAAEITAAAGAGLAFKNAMEQYTTATTQLVQTTGQIGDNAWDAAKRADDLADAYRISVAEMGKFGIAADKAKASAAELVKLYGGRGVKGGDFQDAMTTIGMMERATGMQTEELTAIYRKRFLEQGRTMGQTTLEIAHVVKGYEDLREAQQKMQASGANVAEMFRADFTKAVVESANELSPMTADLDKVQRLVGAAAKSAMQLGLKMGDINKVSAQITKGLKLPQVIQFDIGREVLRDVQAQRAKLSDTEFNKFLSQNFKGYEQQMRQLLDDFEKKGPSGLSEWNTAQAVMQFGAGQGLVTSKTMKRTQELAGNAEQFIKLMQDNFGGDLKLTMIARQIFQRGGTMDEVAKQMEEEAKKAGGQDKEANERAANAAKAAKDSVQKQHKAAKTWLDEWKSWLLSQFQSPIRSLMITMGGLGAWALVNVVANRMIAGGVAVVAKEAEMAATAAGAAAVPGAAGAGGTAGKVGSWFSRHPKMGSALAVGAVAATGYAGVSALSASDPEKMRKELEKSVGLSPGDLEQYSSPDKINAQLAADALREDRKTGGVGAGPPAPAAAGRAGLTTDASGQRGAAAAVRAQALLLREQQRKADIETAGSGIPALLTMGLGGHAAEAFTSVRGWKQDWIMGRVRKALPDRPEGYSAQQIAAVREATNSVLLAPFGRAEYRQRIREMEAQNLELRLRQYEKLQEGLSRAGSSAEYLKTKDAQQKLEIIRQLAGDDWAEHAAELARAGRLSEQITATRENMARQFGIKTAAALGAQEQQRQRPAGNELLIGPDGRPLTNLSQAMLRLRFQANNFDASTGALVCEWTNPGVVSTIFQAVRLHAQGGKAAAPRRE